jgi:citrate lyase subunit beta / citryl-CoA lyase
LELATMAKNLGFKGAICPHPSWIEPVNVAFSPTSEEVAYYTKVRQVFADGVARGTAAVPLDGKMIDVPVDEWAKVVLALAAVCRARDLEKQRALQQAAVAHS